MESSSLRFATAVRVLGAAARSRDLQVPAFRSPPRVAGSERTLRRRADGGITVAVRLRDRPFNAVLSDMVEGVIVANGLSAAEATRVRTALWDALTAEDRDAA